MGKAAVAGDGHWHSSVVVEWMVCTCWRAMRAATVALRPLISTHRRSCTVSNLMVPADRAEVLFAALRGCVKHPFEYSAADAVATLWGEALGSAWGVVNDLTLALRLLPCMPH